jgi:hypothetical protein
MKTLKLLITFILLLGIIYFVLDRDLYFYGKNDLGIYKRLPFNIEPEERIDYKGGFLLKDGDDFNLVSKGEVQYAHSEIKLTITDILKYGFNENELVAHVQDISGPKFFIKIIKNDGKQIKQDLIVIILDETKFNGSEKYKWIILKGNKSVVIIELVRNILRISTIGLIIALIVLLSTRKANSSNK